VTRKPYADIVKKKVEELRTSVKIMVRLGAADPERPDHNELGDVFDHVYRHIEAQGEKSAIMRAFAACDLHIENPFHWANLMSAFCELHFPPPRRSGPTKRTDEFFNTLSKRRAQLAKILGRVGVEQEAKLLRKKYPTDYGNITSATLRRIIADIGKPARSRAEPEPKASRSPRRELAARLVSSKVTLADLLRYAPPDSD
jgi:hypothetical protein